MSHLEQLIKEIQDENPTRNSLRYGNPNLGDQGARLIAELLHTNTRIEILALGFSIGDVGAKCLAQMLQTNTKINYLNLSSNKIGAEGAKYLAQALEKNNVLTNITLGSNQLGDEGARHFAKLLEINSTLTSVDLEGNNIGDQGAKILAEAMKINKNIKELGLRCNNIGPQGAKALLEVPDIQRLVLTYNPIGDEGVKYFIEALESNKQITRLDFTRMQGGDEGARLLGSFFERDSIITEVNLHGNNIGDLGAKYLAQGLEKNNTLRSINLDSNVIENGGVEWLLRLLEANPTLGISIQRNEKIGKEILEKLGDRLKLGRLFDHLRKHTKGRYYINIASAWGGDEGVRYIIEAIEKNSEIEMLWLNSSMVGPKGAKLLAQILETNSTIEFIGLGSCSLGTDGIRYIADILEFNSRLKTMILSDDNIGDEGMRYLAEGLQNNTTLQRLEISGCKIMHQGAKYFAEILGGASQLNQVQFYLNPIQDEGFRYIIDALKENKTIEKVDLGGLGTGEEGVKMIASLLETNSTITSLFLAYFGITQDSIKYITNALEHNTTLKCLDLRNDSIGNQGAAHILEMLNKNITLEEIKTYQNGIDKEMMDLIRGKLAENNSKRNKSPSEETKDPSSSHAQQDNLITRPTHILDKKIAQLERKMNQAGHFVKALDLTSPVAAQLFSRFEKLQGLQKVLVNALSQDTYNDKKQTDAAKIQINDLREKIFDFETTIKRIITTNDYSKEEIIMALEILEERDQKLSTYCTTFFWVTLNLFEAYRQTSANETGNLHIKESVAVKGSTVAAKYGAQIIQAGHLSGSVLIAVDRTIEDIYSGLNHNKNKNRITAIHQIINDKLEKKEDIAVDIANIALSITEARAAVIMEQQLHNPHDVLDEEVKRVKGKIFDSLKVDKKNKPAATLALRDVFLMIVHLCVNSMGVLETQMKLDVQIVEGFKNGELEELLRNYEKPKSKRCELF